MSTAAIRKSAVAGRAARGILSLPVECPVSPPLASHRGESDPGCSVGATVSARLCELMADLAHRCPSCLGREESDRHLRSTWFARRQAVYCPLIYGYMNYAAPGIGPLRSLSSRAGQSPGGRLARTLGAPEPAFAAGAPGRAGAWSPAPARLMSLPTGRPGSFPSRRPAQRARSLARRYASIAAWLGSRAEARPRHRKPPCAAAPQRLYPFQTEASAAVAPGLTTGNGRPRAG